MIKVFIDCGHGGMSIGASYEGRLEQDDCLKLGKLLRDTLLTQEKVSVKMSRSTNSNPSIAERCKMGNEWGANYFLSIHRNSSVKPNNATGCEIWVHSKTGKTSATYKTAKKINDNVCKITGYKNRGVKLGAVSYTDYGVNSQTQMSSALIEIGFINNDSDNEIFDRCLTDMATAIAKAIVESFGLVWVEKATHSDTMYRVITGSYEKKANAKARVTKLKKAGFESFIVDYIHNSKPMYRVVTGSFENINNAEIRVKMLKKAGFDSFITTYNG